MTQTEGTGLPGFDSSAGDAARALDSLRRDPRERDGRVCACGHPMTKHDRIDMYQDGTDVRLRCNPVRMRCPCEDPKPVVEVSDIRPFLHATKGRAGRTALLLGLQALASKGKEWHWTEGWPRCELAGWDAVTCVGERGVAPYPLTKTGVIVDEASTYTFLLCAAHAAAVVERGFPS